MAEPPPMEARKRSHFHELPDELVAEILSRIQVKTLCKFKCVCKQWRDLISNAGFHRLHHEKSTQNPSVLYLDHSFQREGSKCTSSVGIYSVNLDGDVTLKVSIPSLGSDDETFLPKYAMMASASLCQDFVCLATNEKFYVCNPSTQDFIQLPEAPGNSILWAKGFGYDPARDEYICIRVLRVESDEQYGLYMNKSCETFIFSSKDGGLGIYKNAWRNIHKFSSINFLPGSSFAWGIMVKGLFYWIVCDIYCNASIFSLDLSEDNPKIFPPPPTTSLKALDGEDYYGRLVELGGQVCMVDPTVLNPNPKMDIWKLKKDSKNCMASWAKCYSIPLPSGFDYKLEYLNPLGEIGNGGGLFFNVTQLHKPLVISGNCSNRVLCYNKENSINAWRLMTKDLKLNCPKWRSMKHASFFCLHTDNFLKFWRR